MLAGFIMWVLNCGFYGFELPFKTSPDDIPDIWGIIKHMVLMMLMEDFTFYWCHRALHIKHPWFNLYKWVHKDHHEYKQPVGSVTFHMHLVEYIINSLCHFSGGYVLGGRLHFFTLLIFSVLRLFETYDSHSGYEFPWSMFRVFPFGTDAAYHNFHHTKNAGNYSSFFYVWDTIFDTNTEYYRDSL